MTKYAPSLLALLALGAAACSGGTTPDAMDASGSDAPSADAVEVAPLTLGDAGTSGAQATVIAPGQRGASQLVADATAVYWVTKTPPTTVGGLNVATSTTCLTDAYGVCCGAVCVPNDCAIMKMVR
jgi:hypothetical protein